MTKLWWLSVLVILAAALSACNSEPEKETTAPETPEPIEVELSVPDQANVNENIQMKAAVSQGGEPVADADEVEFEIWEEGKKDESQLVEAKNNENGTYEADTAFDRDGVFTIQVHVTARGLHTMPMKSVTVGSGAEKAQTATDEEHSHGEHAEGFSLHFTEPESLQAGGETTLTTHLQMDGSPLEKAQVRYEIWPAEDEHQIQWVDTIEEKPGEYSAAHTFDKSGIFHVQVHVENDEGLHEHQEYELNVQ
ncbi:FixH family protein [Bacillus thermotolerans]|uniref:YznA protein n=1 Tax=Bacillus thermotolerans TaxID=1221996 RepID=A0A0F5I7Q0_BACTR|nr:FixH family protein [Bacillus thermotolerans]KKB41531.1 yznA protein [Bacillus thermotolerans]